MRRELELIEELKHLAGEHDQRTHDPTHGTGKNVDKGDEVEFSGKRYTVQEVTPTHIVLYPGKGALSSRVPIDVFEKRTGMTVEKLTNKQSIERGRREAIIADVTNKRYTKPDGSKVSAKDHLDDLIKQGYNSIISQRQGAVSRQVLVDKEGRTVKLGPEELAYAKLAIGLKHLVGEHDQSTHASKKTKIWAMRKAGRQTTGRGKDSGQLFHACPENSNHALCGAAPGRHADWSSYYGSEITCPGCKKKLEQLPKDSWEIAKA